MSLLSRRDFLKLSGAALLSAPFVRLDLPPANVAPVIYHGSRRYREIAMTYDDCWHPEVLQQLSDLLKPYPDFHFTFFAIGDAINIDEALKPGIWKRLYESGHEIGYHTYHHVDPQVMSTKALIADFDQWENTLSRVLGFQPNVRFARPPYDDLSLSFQELCKERGMVATLFSTGFEAQKMEDSMRLAERAQNGDIVQMHTYQDPPHGRFDLDISIKVIPYLAGKGFSLVTMSQLYDDSLVDQLNTNGCVTGPGKTLGQNCVEPR